MMKTTEKLIFELEDEMYLMQLADLYGDDRKALYQNARYISLLKGYESVFGQDEVRIFSAPGRTEIGGNHTDHQQGLVIAASVDRDAIAVAGYREDNRIWIYSEGYGAFELDGTDLEPKEEEKGTAPALVRGVLAGMVRRQHIIGGFKAYIASDVLSGSGLSSSAAFETLIGTMVSGLYNDNLIAAEEIAVIGQFAENVYFGKPSGLMDQMACSVGGACFIDFRGTPKVRRIPFDPAAYGYELCITDTKGSHADLTEDYAAVPAEMKSVARRFGRSVLGELTEEELLAAAGEVREHCGDRAFLRALHYVTENRRVGEMAEALQEADFGRFLRLVRASGDSSYKFLQNVYTVRDVEHQNLAVAIAVSESVLRGEGACRVHGGGFAGTVQAYVPKELVERYGAAMDGLFGKGACRVYKIRKVGGLEVL